MKCPALAHSFKKLDRIAYDLFAFALIGLQTRFPVYMNHFPSGTSKMNLLYYSQIMQEDQCTTHWNEVCAFSAALPILDIVKMNLV